MFESAKLLAKHKLPCEVIFQRNIVMHVNLILQDFGRKVAQTSGKHYKLDRIRLMPTFIEQARQIFLEKK